jgi:hypothetical protein
MGPAPTLPVMPLWARLRPPPAPAGVSSCHEARAGNLTQVTDVGDNRALMAADFAEAGQMGTISKTA